MNTKTRMLSWAALFILIPSLMKAQSLSAKTFFNTDTISAVYLGIDFTLAKLINDDASNATVIQSQQFNGINDLIVKENKKYDVQEAYRRISWIVDTKEVEARNLKANPDQLKSSNEADLNRLNPGDIENLVKEFNYGSRKGYGILLIMEGMSKTGKLATIWFTLIDMDKKTVLKTQRVEGKLGSGFGFRNYWASAIKNAIGQVKSKDYEQWKTGADSK
jgi:hypothetical protein